jgi:5-formyltetrahydrofolate cyclo-ligase
MRADRRGTARLKELRTALRRRRAELAATEVAALSLRIARHLWRLPMLARAERIACYVAVGGEVDCTPVMTEAIVRGRRLFLPVIHGQRLLFAPWEPAAPMLINRFGIPEPRADAGSTLSGTDLDVVLAPLVAFDDQGNRLGMGGGFYDRTLRFMSARGAWRRPRFIGLAYEFQRVAALPASRWDVPLHCVVTERGARIF